MLPHDKKQLILVKISVIRMDTSVPIRFKDIFTKNNYLFVMGQRFRIQKKTHNDTKFSKEVKIMVVVDKRLHSLKRGE